MHNIDEYLKYFSTAIKVYRKWKGYSQLELASLAGVNTRHYQRIENCEVDNVTLKTAHALSSALDTDIRSLILGDELKVVLHDRESFDLFCSSLTLQNKSFFEAFSKGVHIHDFIGEKSKCQFLLTVKDYLFFSESTYGNHFCVPSEGDIKTLLNDPRLLTDIKYALTMSSSEFVTFEYQMKCCKFVSKDFVFAAKRIPCGPQCFLFILAGSPLI